jgi:hypothetical protein
MYEFVQKLAKKKRNQVGISTQTNILWLTIVAAARHPPTYQPPPALLYAHFIYRTIRLPSKN